MVSISSPLKAAQGMLRNTFSDLATQLPEPKIFPLMFQPDDNYAPHTIGDTFKAIDEMALNPRPVSAREVLDYVTKFARRSPVMRGIDHECRSMGPDSATTDANYVTYPDLIVDLAGKIPVVALWSYTHRGDFMAVQLAESETFRFNLFRYGYDGPGDKVGIGAAMNRALRLLSVQDETGEKVLRFTPAAWDFVRSLSERLPEYAPKLLDQAYLDFCNQFVPDSPGFGPLQTP